MPRQSRSAAAGQHSQAIIQACGDLLEPKRGDASCRKIDGQRDAVEAPTDCSNCWKVLSVRREIRMQRPRPGDEELHRAVSKYIAGFLMLGRNIQWGNAVNVLALD